MTGFLRRSFATLIGSATLFVAAAALADGEPCYNDTDCPGGGDVCGGDVCNWGKLNSSPVGTKLYTCNPAGTNSKGSDGWCTTNDNCKCRAQGATCIGVYCTFTKASDAPAGSGGANAAGGASANGGMAAKGGASAAGGATAAGGAAATGGATAAAGATSTAGATSSSSSNSGGCRVAAPGTPAGNAALTLGVFALGLAFAGRRRAR